MRSTPAYGHRRRTGLGLRATLYGAEVQCDQGMSGRPAPLPEVAGPQDPQQRRFVELITENFVLVRIRDVLVASAVMEGV